VWIITIIADRVWGQYDIVRATISVVDDKALSVIFVEKKLKR